MVADTGRPLGTASCNMYGFNNGQSLLFDWCENPDVAIVAVKKALVNTKQFASVK